MSDTGKSSTEGLSIQKALTERSNSNGHGRGGGGAEIPRRDGTGQGTEQEELQVRDLYIGDLSCLSRFVPRFIFLPRIQFSWLMGLSQDESVKCRKGRTRGHMNIVHNLGSRRQVKILPF